MSAPGLPEELKENIRSLRQHGWSYKRIARHLRVTKGQVAGVVWRAGLCQKKEESSADYTAKNAERA